MITRERDCTPLPHDLVHDVQPWKALTLQWMGHGPSVHERVSVLCGQALPPNLGATLVRERDEKPALQVVLHLLQAE